MRGKYGSLVNTLMSIPRGHFIELNLTKRQAKNYTITAARLKNLGLGQWHVTHIILGERYEITREQFNPPPKDTHR